MNDKTILKYNILEKEYRKYDNGKTYVRYIVPCSICQENKSVSLSQLQRHDTYSCDKCKNKGENRRIRSAGLKKRKTNTSGYIGVCVIKDKNGEDWGYQAYLANNNKKILRNKYKDEYLNKQTLYQAVVDRDLFIIERKLPHRRNLSDKELIKYSEMLVGYNKNKIINLIKKSMDKVIK